MLRFLVLLVGMLPLAAAAPTPAERRLLDSLPMPRPEVVESAVKAYFGNELRDPESARFTFDRPVKAVIQGPNTRIEAVWVCGTVNAKNAYGGYVGRRTYLALFQGDEVTRGTIVDRYHLHIPRWCDEVYRDAIR